MFRKIFVISMLLFLCLIQLGCCNSHTKMSKKDINAFMLNNKLKNHKESKVRNQNFIFLSKFIMTKNHNDYNELCYADKHNSIECNDPLIPLNSASGYIVKVDKKTNRIYALTAAHWCLPVEIKEITEITDLLFDNTPIVGSFVNFMGEQYRVVKPMIIDYKTDLCLLEFRSKYSKYAKSTKIAKKSPAIGEIVHSISAPQWSYENTMRQHYQGKFAGCDSHECSFTIPATYGSSGSAVINEKGEIISIISRAAIEFNNYALGPKPAMIRSFLKENL